MSIELKKLIAGAICMEVCLITPVLVHAGILGVKAVRSWVAVLHNKRYYYKGDFFYDLRNGIPMLAFLCVNGAIIGLTVLLFLFRFLYESILYFWK